MKHLYLALTLTLFCAANTSAQSVNGVPLKDLESEYVEIMADVKTFRDKIALIVDAGQERNRLYSRSMKLLDAGGKEMLFNSMMDALTFMSRNGYELVQAFRANRDELYGQYLLRRKKKD